MLQAQHGPRLTTSGVQARLLSQTGDEASVACSSTFCQYGGLEALNRVFFKEWVGESGGWGHICVLGLGGLSIQ